jgi:hypothetical protein
MSTQFDIKGSFLLHPNVFDVVIERTPMPDEGFLKMTSVLFGHATDLCVHFSEGWKTRIEALLQLAV